MKFHVQLCVQQPGNTTLSIQNVYVHLFLKAIVVEPENYSKSFLLSAHIFYPQFDRVCLFLVENELETREINEMELYSCSKQPGFDKYFGPVVKSFN